MRRFWIRTLSLCLYWTPKSKIKSWPENSQISRRTQSSWGPSTANRISWSKSRLVVEASSPAWSIWCRSHFSNPKRSHIHLWLQTDPWPLNSLIRQIMSSRKVSLKEIFSRGKWNASRSSGMSLTRLRQVSILEIWMGYGWLPEPKTAKTKSNDSSTRAWTLPTSPKQKKPLLTTNTSIIPWSRS